MVTYSMYTDGHNGCKRKKLGTYTTPMLTFLKANGAQQTKDAEYTNGKYQGYDLMAYMYCTAYKYNDAYVSGLFVTWYCYIVSQSSFNM
jgi:hypothetical protein